MTHHELCHIAAKYLRNKGIQPFHRCQYVVVDLVRSGEQPDAFGFGSCATQLIEVKISRQDFIADKKKFYRINPGLGLGTFRSFLCPADLIQVDELPPKWGLLYVDNNKKVIEIKKPEAQESDQAQEMHLMRSIWRRIGIRPQIFSFKKTSQKV